MMWLRRSIVFSLLILALVACEKAEPDPTKTPDLASRQTAQAMFAPTDTPVRLTPTTVSSEVEIALNDTITWMRQAVLNGNYEGYMQYVWPGDPLFAAEQAQWADDWLANPLSRFDATLSRIQMLDDDTAEARLAIQWTQREQNLSGGAIVSVTFHQEGDEWLLGGESWEVIETPGIHFYYFDNEISDNQRQAKAVEEYLPAVYARLTSEFDFTPDATAHFKMYEKASTLQTWTRMSIAVLTVWNEPGEAIKITLGPQNTPPRDELIAREYARFLLYEMAGGTAGDFPWWFEAGVAEYGGFFFRRSTERDPALMGIARLLMAPDDAEAQVIPWEEMQTEPDWPGDKLDRAATQAYTLVAYIHQTYPDRLNPWIKAIAGGQSVDEATQTYLGLSFIELDAAWRAWLAEQLA